MFISSRQYGASRRVPKLDRFMLTIYNQVQYAKIRFDQVETKSSPYIKFFTKLLTTVNDEYTLKGDMLDVYMEILSPEVPTVIRMFDMVQSKHGAAKGIFIKNTKEIFIPTSGVLGTLATALDDWSVWKNIFPVKLVYMDSTELMVNWYDTISFKKDPPTFAVYAIDVEAMLVKYYVYLREHGIGLDNPDIHLFIRSHLYKGLYEDFIDVWMNKLLLHTSRDEIMDFNTTASLGTSEYNDAAYEVKELFDDYVRGQFRLGSFLNTKFYGNRSITDMFYTQENIYVTPPNNRYLGFQLLKIADQICMITNALIASRDRGLESASIRKIVEDIRFITRSDWSHHINDLSIRAEIDSLLTHVSLLGMETT